MSRERVIVEIGTNTVWAKDVAIADVFVRLENWEAPDEPYFIPKPVYFNTFQGTAKKNPEDKPDEIVAKMLATGRALEKAGQRLQQVAINRTKHLDSIAEQKPTQAKKKAKWEKAQARKKKK